MNVSRFPTSVSIPVAPGTVIALHCSGSSGRQWEACRAMARGDGRWLTPDLLGYGPQSWGAGRAVSLDEEADRIARLLPGGEPVAVVGHSYGGAVALQLALRWPGRVASLTLYEPVRFALLLSDPALRGVGESVIAAGRRIGSLAGQGELHAAARAFVDYWSGTGSWERLQPSRRDAVATRMHKVAAEFDALFQDPVRPMDYAALRMPVRLLQGTRSPNPARQVVAALATRIRHAHVFSLARLGHMGPVTDPDRVANYLPQVGSGAVKRAA